ncbi:MAG: serine--tRNA ligase, partial [Leifsonia sp.]
MIDPVLLREDPARIKASQEARGDSPALVDEALAADGIRRAAISEFEHLRAEQNAFGKRVAQAAPDEKKALVAEVQQLAARVKAASQAAADATARFDEIVRGIGNVIIDGVPPGGEDDFVTLREVGEIPAFDFPARDHLEIGELLDAIDMTRG